ncbi:transporter, major facilitator family protein [Gemella bergeri ATCC 700627]|uniref:Transporter, major facilitator family protein n=1 Tax=Gemella bergeri ATCC 700627 TaxID=1321820 RepID=U2S5R6_9BACL|nr:MFS transporter [Gemella bergeri]ERK58122.1 transporter, major facilitator family protein [Gemella bergeri ATCC 700627]
MDTHSSDTIQNEKLFNKGFITITSINFIVFLIYYCFVVITAKFATGELHSSAAEAGFAAGIYIIGTLIARLYMGKKLEIVGRKQILRFGALIYLITTAAYLISSNIIILDTVRFLNGFAYGTISTAANAIVTAYIPKSRNGEGINYYGLSTSLAAAVGPFIGMLLLPMLGFNAIIILAIVLSVVVAVACFVFPVQNIKLSAEQKSLLNSWSLNTFIEYKVLFISLVAFLIGLAYSSVLGFLSIYADNLHLSTAGAFFFVVYALIITATRPFAGRIFDARGENAVMYPSFVFLALGLIMLSFTNGSFMLLLSGALIGLGYGTFMSNGQAVCLKLVDSTKVGIALSTYFIGLDLGLGFGPYALGTVHSVLSYSGIYILCAILTIFVTVLYALFYKSKDIKVLQTKTSR